MVVLWNQSENDIFDRCYARKSHLLSFLPKNCDNSNGRHNFYCIWRLIRLKIYVSSLYQDLRLMMNCFVSIFFVLLKFSFKKKFFWMGKVRGIFWHFFGFGQYKKFSYEFGESWNLWDTHRQIIGYFWPHKSNVKISKIRDFGSFWAFFVFFFFENVIVFLQSAPND